jgi:hypothetical protein
MNWPKAMRIFVAPSKNILLGVSVCLLALVLLRPLARGAEWKRWPAKADEFATTIGVPPGFTPIGARRSPAAGDAGREPLFDARFRSADRKVEFAVTVYYVRMWPQAPEARRIAAAITSGEKIVERKTSRKQFTGEHGDYWLYDEEMTVAGDGYTRYLLNSFSTSNLPGASSELWEFRATDDESRKRSSAVFKIQRLARNWGGLR